QVFDQRAVPPGTKEETPRFGAKRFAGRKVERERVGARMLDREIDLEPGGKLRREPRRQLLEERPEPRLVLGRHGEVEAADARGVADERGRLPQVLLERCAAGGLRAM